MKKPHIVFDFKDPLTAIHVNGEYVGFFSIRKDGSVLAMIYDTREYPNGIAKIALGENNGNCTFEYRSKEEMIEDLTHWANEYQLKQLEKVIPMSNQIGLL